MKCENGEEEEKEEREEEEEKEKPENRVKPVTPEEEVFFRRLASAGAVGSRYSVRLVSVW